MPVPPPSKHQLALMVWLAVLPTLLGLNLTVGRLLGGLTTVSRTFVLVTVAVPIVVYGLLPLLHRWRARLLTTPRLLRETEDHPVAMTADDISHTGHLSHPIPGARAGGRSSTHLRVSDTPFSLAAGL